MGAPPTEGSSDFPSHWPCVPGAHCELNNAAGTAGSNEGALMGPPSLSEGSGRPFSPWFGKLLQRALCIAGSFRPAPHEIPKTKASSAPSQSCTNPFPGLVSPELGFSVTFPSSYFFIRYFIFKWLQIHRKLQTGVHREYSQKVHVLYFI